MEGKFKVIHAENGFLITTADESRRFVCTSEENLGMFFGELLAEGFSDAMESGLLKNVVEFEFSYTTANHVLKENWKAGK